MHLKKGKNKVNEQQNKIPYDTLVQEFNNTQNELVVALNENKELRKTLAEHQNEHCGKQQSKYGPSILKAQADLLDERLKHIQALLNLVEVYRQTYANEQATGTLPESDLAIDKAEETYEKTIKG